LPITKSLDSFVAFYERSKSPFLAFPFRSMVNVSTRLESDCDFISTLWTFLAGSCLVFYWPVSELKISRYFAPSFFSQRL
jgi:hypothetical protein